MKTYLTLATFIIITLLTGCSSTRKVSHSQEANNSGIHSEVVLLNKVPARKIDTRQTPGSEVVKFAETLLGIKYTYGSSVREKGFDCSGFISYVFTHFNIAVPRSSVDFTNAGTEVPLRSSLPGDIILFTGSNQKSGVVGHMGIITENKNGHIQFIHASESRGVMISGMNAYFVPRFVKVNRVFTVF